MAHQVVVDHNHLQAHLRSRSDRLIGRCAAVHGDDQLGAALAQMAEGGGAGAITLGDAVRHIDGQVLAHGAEPADQEGRAGGAVHIIVGEHSQGPIALQGVDQQLGGPVHVHEGGRVGKQALERGIEKRFGLILADAARRQGAGQGLAQAMALDMGAHSGRIGETLAPAAAAKRAGHPQKGLG